MIGAIYAYGFGSERLRPAAIRDLILAWGYWGPFLYILCNGIRPFLFFPAMVLGTAGGLAFGPLWGTIYLITGTALGAALCFGTARLLGYDRVKRVCPQWLPVTELENPVKHGFRTVLLLRLAPILPWDAVSFMAGLSKVRFWPYFWASVIGSAPGAAAFSYLGDSLSQSFARTAVTAAGIGVIAIGLYLYSGSHIPSRSTSPGE